MVELKLFSTLGCHLCDDAKAVCWGVLPHYYFELSEVDIADDDKLMDAYALRIPVVKIQGVEGDLGWPFSEQQLLDYLTRNTAL